MYFKTGDYPIFQGVNRKERNKVVAEAVKANNKWVNVRFILAICVLFIFAISVAKLENTFELPGWTPWVIFPVFGILFYTYLLWEINGAVFDAVKEYTDKPNNQMQPTPNSGAAD
ncbi:hypothetical protein [Paraglaciecola aestuariivivens]